MLHCTNNAANAKEEEVQQANALSVFPNPSRRHVTVGFYSPLKERVNMIIYSADGRTTESTTQFVTVPGYNQRSVSVKNKLPGVYYLVIVRQTGERETSKLIIE